MQPTASLEASDALCSPRSPWWPFPYLLGISLFFLLNSFRSRATSRVTPMPVMSSLVGWCHVFLGRPRRLVPGIASSITAGDVVCISSLDTPKPTKTATAHNLVDRWNVYASDFLVSHLISSRHSEDPAKHPHLRGSNLSLVGHLHCPAFASG